MLSKGNRTHTIKLRLSDEEYEELLKLKEVHDMNLSEFIRWSIFNKTISINVNEGMNICKLSELITDNGKIGGNLNQIAKFLNQYGDIDSNLLTLLTDNIAELHKLNRTISDYFEEYYGDSKTYIK